jgi:hypothetical protein
MRLEFLPVHDPVDRERVGNDVKRVVLEVHDPPAVLRFQVGFVHHVAFRHAPRPDLGAGRVGFNGIARRVRQVRTDDLQRAVLVVRDQGAMQRKEFRQDGFQG